MDGWTNVQLSAPSSFWSVGKKWSRVLEYTIDTDWLRLSFYLYDVFVQFPSTRCLNELTLSDIHSMADNCWLKRCNRPSDTFIDSYCRFIHEHRAKPRTRAFSICCSAVDWSAVSARACRCLPKITTMNEKQMDCRQIEVQVEGRPAICRTTNHGERWRICMYNV